jgi:M6 family metalloprotease-like protein
MKTRDSTVAGPKTKVGDTMNKRLAVLLLRIAGAPDLPSKAYAEQLFTNAGKGTRNLVDYFDQMSHGRLDIGQSQVFDWIDYGHTKQDLTDELNKTKTEKKEELKNTGAAEADAEDAANHHAIGVVRDKIKEWAREAAAKSEFDLSKFDVLVCIFNQPVDYFANYGEVVLNWDESRNHSSFSIELTGVSHEVLHALGMSHSRREGSGKEYGDRWDIMTAYDSVYRDTSGTQDPPLSSYFTFGPGLNAANMDIAGWLDHTRVFTGRGSVSFQLRPLHQRHLQGWLAARLQIGFESIYLEFRTKDGWDVQIPDPCILLHRRSVHPEDGSPISELLLTNADAKPEPREELLEGESFEIGDAADPFGFFARITATRIDANSREALVNVHIRDHRRIEPQGTVFGGVTSDGGGLVWTPGRGFVKVPPRSPLLEVLEVLSDVETLQGVSSSERNLIEQLTLERLSKAQKQLAGIIDARQQPHVPTPPSVRR